MKNLRLICVSIFIALVFNKLNAAPIDTLKAKQVGLNFWYAYASDKKIDRSDVKVSKTYIIHEDLEPVYYVFNIVGGGFVIVAADDAVIPVLGFSDEGEYVIENQPEVFTEWMNTYKKQILFVKKNNIPADAKAKSMWTYYAENYVQQNTKDGNVKGVNPLLTTKWDQGLNYNYSCPPHPNGPGGKCYAGCVATSMAQIMKYWNYPPKGYNSHSYYHPYYGIISVDFSQQEYEWSKMQNTISSTSKEAISTLIYHCGVSVNMNYSPIASSSFSYLAKDAFRNYFHYRLTTQYIEKADYDSISWEDIIIDNLDAGMPVLYSGSGSSGGHAFVCDGYTNNRYFHMNWGWSGLNNGFFVLNNLNSGNGDFTSDQSAVINIAPYDAPYCKTLREYTKETAEITDGSGYSMYWPNTHCSWLINPQTGSKITIQFNSFDTEPDADILYIYDGSSNNAPLLGAFSGHNLPPTIVTTGKKAFLEFVSDDKNSFQGWSLTYTAATVNIEENYIKDFNIFPNPVVNNEITITFGGVVTPIDYNINIYDIVGKNVYSSIIPKGKQSFVINTDMLNSGAYIVSLSSANNQKINKIIIK